MILDYGADEFALKPSSAENTSDKILMLLARDKVPKIGPDECTTVSMTS